MSRPQCPGSNVPAPMSRPARQAREAGTAQEVFQQQLLLQQKAKHASRASGATNPSGRSGPGGGGRARRRAGRSEPSAKAARRGERARRCGFGAQGAEPGPRSKAGPRRPARVSRTGQRHSCKRPKSAEPSSATAASGPHPWHHTALIIKFRHPPKNIFPCRFKALNGLTGFLRGWDGFFARIGLRGLKKLCYSSVLRSTDT